MDGDNKNDDDNQKQRQLKAAIDEVRKEVLPPLEKAYDKHGPAAVLGLTDMLADIWEASGFKDVDWRAFRPSRSACDRED
jgi:hypothetical protein